MAITYNLEDYRVSFHWDQDTDLWHVKSDDIKDLDLEAKSFNTVIKMLSQKHPEFTNAICIFFPDSINDLPQKYYP